MVSPPIVRMDSAEKIRSALYTGIVGDTLGVPAEEPFTHEASLCAVKNLLGYGRYDQPLGTWSDDTSMVLCTMESLIRGYDLNDMGKTFCRWLFEAYWTPFGQVVDCGVTTFLALEELRSGVAATHSGQRSEDDNGNGCLMRILPSTLFFRNQELDAYLATIHDITAITHAHPRSKAACGIYATLMKHLITSHKPKKDAFFAAMHEAADYYQRHEEFRPELRHFERILSGAIASMPREEISVSGYIVDTLESSLWCFLNNDSARNVVWATASMGLETDTTSMAAGGLAGAYYGMSGVPSEWTDSLARREEIDQLIEKFVQAALRQ